MENQPKIPPIQASLLLTILLVIVYFSLPTNTVQGLSLHKWLSPKPKLQKVISTYIIPSLEIEHSTPQPMQTTTGRSEKVLVLMYHHVADLSVEQRQKDPLASDLTVDLTDFENQVKYFHDQGYVSVSVAKLYDSLINTTNLPKKSLVFTFDDGYADVFTNAIPILQKYGYTGSFAIATELLGRPSYASWNDVVAADKQGMEILSHTENHLDLTSLKYSEDDLKREIFEAKTVLEIYLGHPVEFFVYPYGHYNYHVAELVGQAGYKMAFTTNFGLYINSDQLFSEPRVRIHGVNGLENFKKVISSKPHSVSVQTNP